MTPPGRATLISVFHFQRCKILLQNLLVNKQDDVAYRVAEAMQFKLLITESSCTQTSLIESFQQRQATCFMKLVPNAPGWTKSCFLRIRLHKAHPFSLTYYPTPPQLDPYYRAFCDPFR